MSGILSRSGGAHAITVDMASDVLEALPHGRLQHHVDWPHLWKPGDNVAILSSDDRRYVGMVLDVSMVRKTILIELDT